MQITFTSEQLSWVRTAVGTLSTILTLWGIIRKGYKQVMSYVIDSLHTVITQNVNRAIKENKEYADSKFTEHEFTAFKRLDAQDVKIAALIEAVESINKKLGDK